MSSAMPGATDRKPTWRTGRKAPTLRPDPNTSGTAGVRVVKTEMEIWEKKKNQISIFLT